MQALLVDTPAAHVVRLTLNRPEAANALSAALAHEIADAFQKLVDARVVILTGAGSRAFCAGADLKERLGMDESAWQAQHKALEDAVYAVRDCRVPVIAAVNGAAYAGGLELALACDFILSATTARFALTEATLGIMPGLGGTQALPRAIGMRAAKEMLFTGTPIDAPKAHAIGLVNHLHPQEHLQEHALELAKRIAANAPLSLTAIKAAMREGEGKSLMDAMTTELSHYGHLITTHDRIEGNRAFLEKRKPRFEGK